jgi:hypothetical protein
MLKAEHIPGKINSIADALSRSDWQRFKTLCPEADPEPTEIPDHLWKIRDKEIGTRMSDFFVVFLLNPSTAFITKNDFV